MWWLALAACLVSRQVEIGRTTTLCDGCFTSSTTGTQSSTARVSGAVHLLELALGDPEPRSVRTWPGNHEESVGRRLVAVGDLDGDGLEDTWTNGFGAVLRSSDREGLRFATLFADPVVAVGDLDADGAIELVLGGVNAKVTSVLPGAELLAGGSFEFGDGWGFVGDHASGFPAPDADADGLADTSWIDQDPDGDGMRVHVLPGASSAGELRRRDALATVAIDADVLNGGGAFDLGDVDGDGVSDLGVAALEGNLYRADLTLGVWSGAALAVGEQVEVASLVVSGADRPTIQVERLGDLDADGLDDLAIVVFSTDSSVGALLSGAELRGSSRLVDVGDPIPGLPPQGAIDAADLDGDGLSELLVADAAGLGSVHLGSDLAAGVDAPAWTWTLGGVTAALAGLDRSGALRVWVGDPAMDVP